MPKYRNCEICGEISGILFCRFCERCKKLVDDEYEKYKIIGHEMAVDDVKQKVKGLIHEQKKP